MRFGEELKAKRKSLEMTQKEFSKILGITVNTLVKYERESYIPTEKKQMDYFNKISAWESATKHNSNYFDKDNYDNSIYPKDYFFDSERKHAQAATMAMILNEYFKNFSLRSNTEKTAFCYIDKINGRKSEIYTKANLEHFLSVLYDIVSGTIDKWLFEPSLPNIEDIAEEDVFME